MPELQDVDDSILARMRDTSGDKFVVELIELFLEHVPKKIAEAVAGERAGDLVAVERAAHSVRSSAGIIGAEALLELSGEIEQLASEKKQKSLPNLIGQLEAAYTRLRPYLDMLKKGMEE